jgi:hypothetical protein
MLIQTIATTALVALSSSFQTLAEDHPLQSHLDDAEKLRDVYTSPQAQQMLDEVQHLPVCEPRTIYAAFRPNRAVSADQYEQLPEEEQQKLRELNINPSNYYATFYGSPLVYARTLDLLHKHAPDFTINNANILDLGYGQLGQLRLWAQMGANVTGVEIDPVLTEIYNNCEAVGDLEKPNTGSVTLIEGSFPNSESTRKQVGSGYDLFISRNLLKRGYVKPQKLNPNFPPPVGWEMTDAEMLGHLYDTLNPGAIVIIESLGPKPDPEKPWSDISNPWSKQSWIDAGFKVIAHDQDESKYARSMGAALGWDEQMNLETDLFAVYSMYQKPSSEESKTED